MKTCSILNAFIHHGIYIPDGARLCNAHVQDGILTASAFKTLILTSEVSNIDSKRVNWLVEQLRKEAKKSRFDDFEQISDLNGNDMHGLTGLSKEEISFMEYHLKNMKDSNQRNKVQALLVYLFWLRTGLGHDRVAAIFQLDRRDVKRYLDQVRDSLLLYFVPNYLGVNHLSRIQIQEQTTPMAKELFLNGNANKDSIILVADGTYFYCDKSSYNDFQARSYSGQKNRHLMKYLVVCTTTGYIINVYEFQEAIFNDAEIIKSILQNQNISKNDDLRKLIQPNDVLLLDRGFRDCLSFLKNDLKAIPKTPSSRFLFSLYRIFKKIFSLFSC